MFILTIYVFAQIFSLMMEGKSGFAGTVLAADLEIGATTASVISTAEFKDSGILIIGDETIGYTGVSDADGNGVNDTFTGLSRGDGPEGNKTDEALHKAGKTVYDEAPGFLNRLVSTNQHEVECGAIDVFCWIKGKFKVVGVGQQWISAIPQMIVFDYAYLEGMGVYIKIMLLVVASGLLLDFFRIILGR